MQWKPWNDGKVLKMQTHKFWAYTAIHRLLQMLMYLKVVRIYQPVILKCSKFWSLARPFWKAPICAFVGWLTDQRPFSFDKSSYCYCKLPLKTTERNQEAETVTFYIMAAAEESHVDAAVEAVLWYLHIKRRRKNAAEGVFLGGKDVFALSPTGFGKRLIRHRGARRSPRGLYAHQVSPRALIGSPRCFQLALAAVRSQKSDLSALGNLLNDF